MGIWIISCDLFILSRVYMHGYYSNIPHSGLFSRGFYFRLFSRSNVNRQNKFREIFIQNLYFRFRFVPYLCPPKSRNFRPAKITRYTVYQQNEQSPLILSELTEHNKDQDIWS